MQIRIYLGICVVVFAVMMGVIACDAPPECQGSNVSYTRCIVPTLTSNCSGSGGCHGGDKPEKNLQLEKIPEIYDAIFKKVVFAGGQSRTLVIPGDPDNSYLYIKMKLNPPDGSVMPPDLRPLLSASQLKMFFTWIKEGAKNDDPNYKSTDNPVEKPYIPADVKDVSYKTTIMPLLQKSCGIAGCHTTQANLANVVLDGDFYDKVVGKKSLNGAYELIKKDTPAESLILVKTLAKRPQNAGSLMPPTGYSPLDERSIAQLWVWIEEGAKKE